MKYAYNPSEPKGGTLYRDRKSIKRQTMAIANERLDILDGANLEDIDILGISGEARRKVRRIIEKRVCQELYRKQRAWTADNYGRYNEKRRLSNTLKNIYGQFPYSSEFAA